MTHKLFIQVEYSYHDSLAEFIMKQEFPRAATVQFTYKATNIGETIFPGGVLKEVSADFGPTGIGTLSTVNRAGHAIKPIEPGRSETMYTWSLFMVQQGVVWVKCQIQADDNQPIEYFQGPSASLGTTEWKYPFSVINREQLMSVKLLNEINTKLDALLKK
jgi:hypothetical protein